MAREEKEVEKVSAAAEKKAEKATKEESSEKKIEIRKRPGEKDR
ncbi:hypothetical protein [Thermosediminibacter oceani]|uniref:Uncharacterized protein n=1 Tax=Thermosediminibacter oceani (strain ATCC BAA-1034 / DSM 16646 / JW/IW-1228P) TaxID=555079 RepID=D9S2R7_THEOJ|nr:hypothetical protein [Thermosediminibacter oceani]ADL07694.1 conserved hypothetical protein [Thermosediminibacter oceani DSM 16646]